MAQPPVAVAVAMPVQALRIDPYSSRSSTTRRSLTGAENNDQMDSLRVGADLKMTLPAFPETRKFRDGFWGVCFVVMVVIVFGSGIFYSTSISSRMQVGPADGETPTEETRPQSPTRAVVRRLPMDNHDSRDGENEVDVPVDMDLPLTASIVSTIGGTFGGIIMVALYFYVLKANPEKVVPATLMIMPVLFFTLTIGCAGVGFYMMMSTGEGKFDVGIPFFVASGICFVCFVCSACQAWLLFDMVPFTVEIVKCVMEVTTTHPALIMIAGICTFCSLLWLTICCVAGLGVYLEFEEQIQGAMDNAGTHYVVLFFWSLTTGWGSMVAMNCAVVAYAGVFARWYFGKEGPMTSPSFKVAMGTSFGSVCLGSLIVAVIRAVEAVARQMQREAAENGNVVACLVACCIQSILNCIGDIIEYFNAWAYIQCAVRNASFVEAAKITYSMITCANVHLIFTDILLGWVAGVGTLLASIVGLGVGGLLGWSISGGNVQVAGVSAFAAFFAALITGSLLCDILGTGAKTILVLWAENPEPFQRSHPELHDSIENKIRGKLQEEANTKMAEGGGSIAEMQDFKEHSTTAPGVAVAQPAPPYFNQSA